MKETVEQNRDEYYRQYRAAMARRYRAFDPLSMEALFAMIQTMIGCETQMSTALHASGMSLPALNILGILRQHQPEGCPLHQLSHLLLVSRANITGVVDGLVRKGLVTRQEHATDRRITLARITKAGERWLDNYLPKHYGRAKELFSSLTGEEKRTLIRLMHKLRPKS